MFVCLNGYFPSGRIVGILSLDILPHVMADVDGNASFQAAGIPELSWEQKKAFLSPGSVQY